MPQRPLKRQPASIPSPAPSLLSALFLGELLCESATPPKLSSLSSAKPARQELRQSFLYLDVTSIATIERG